MDLLMFYGLACLSFLRISFSQIPIVIDVIFDQLLFFFRNYHNIDAIFVFDNIVSILFSRKQVKMKVIWRVVFIPTATQRRDAGGGAWQASGWSYGAVPPPPNMWGRQWPTDACPVRRQIFVPLHNPLGGAAVILYPSGLKCDLTLCLKLIN